MKNKITIRNLIITLLIFVAVLLIADYYIGGTLEDYIRGTLTETIGIIITIVLLEILLRKSKEYESRHVARKELRRLTHILHIYIEEYNSAAFNLAYKYADYKEQRDLGIQAGFPFSNLSEFSSSSLYMFDGFNETKVDVYFQRLDNLKNIVRTVLFQVDLSYFPELSVLLERYLKYTETHYPKKSILSDLKTGTLDLIKSMLDKHKGNPEYKESNVINSYVRLYELLNYHISFSIELDKIISRYEKK